MNKLFPTKEDEDYDAIMMPAQAEFLASTKGITAATPDPDGSLAAKVRKAHAKFYQLSAEAYKARFIASEARRGR